MYLGVYGGLGLVQAICVLISALCLALGSKIASRFLHQSILVNVMHSPMSFFETTPLGRIVNRFSKDISTIDDKVPMSLSSFLRTFCAVLGTIVAISFATPIFLAVIVPLGIVYVFIQVTACYVSDVNLFRFLALLAVWFYSHLLKVGIFLLRLLSLQQYKNTPIRRRLTDEQKNGVEPVCSVFSKEMNRVITLTKKKILN